MTHEAFEKLFPGVCFARAISLGGNCEAAHGLRVAGRYTLNGVFDWLVTPLDAISLVLSDDGARLGTELVSVHDGTSVRCGTYGVLYHHEFPRDAENRVVYTADAIAACRAKLTHKMETFLGLRDQGPVLFVRHGLETGLAWDRLGEGKEVPAFADVDALTAAIGRRFPDVDFRVLVTVFEPNGLLGPGAPIDPRGVVTAVPRQETGTWAVADTTWHDLFARVDFVEDRVQSTPIEEKLHWFGDDVVEGPRATDRARATDGAVLPNPRLLLEAALRDGHDTRAEEAISAFVEAGGSPEVAWQSGLALRDAGQSASGVLALSIAFANGFRRWPFVCDYLGLLTGETQYSDVLRVIGILRGEGYKPADPGALRQIAMLSGHAKLALAQPRDIAIERAVDREASLAWLDVSPLAEAIAAAIRERRPFSFVRIGDGEARFLLAATHRGDSPLTAEEAHAMGDLCWENWFGDPLPPVGDASRTTLLATYEHAVRDADVLGVCSADRLRADTGHYGYLAWQEDWLRGVLADRGGLRWADAHANRHLNAAIPFLSTLLEGQDVLGVISPHPRLAEALGRRLRIGRVISHIIPAEGRLPTAGETRALGQHFPAMYEKLLATLSVPRQGCVFLVAAGLLGKVYCARIKQLGGIALDVGSLADAWMGYDTRDGQLANVAVLTRSPSASDTNAATTPARDTTYGCVSLFRTGSGAMTRAIRDAGFSDAVHLHILGPRGLGWKRLDPDPMLDVATDVARRIDDADHRFRFVTTVRDPIARIVSQAFYDLNKQGKDIPRDRDALIAWWDSQAMSQFDVWRVWFDDTFKTTFGFDFREHPFDHERKSIRFSSENLRLLVLRLEDERSRREAEIGWLLECSDVKLQTIGDSTDQGYAGAYRAFLETFTAPSAWLDELYDTEVIRHFYTQAERDAFRTRWGGRAPISSSVPDERPRKFACLSLGKTSSTALAAALTRAGFSGVAHIHHFGPRSRGQKGPAGVEARAFAAHLDDPANKFAIVTCMRDPIARWISYAFQKELQMLGRTGRSVVESAADFIDWVDTNVPSDYLDDWFDDSFGATFGFAFENHPFDFSRRSLRFSSDRLRLVILRQEDPVAYRERELGWLAGRDKIEIPIENESVVRFAGRYQAFVDAFVAPDEWLDRFYETKAVRHFYTRAERDTFRMRWSKRRSTSSSGIRLDAPPVETLDRLSTPAITNRPAPPASPDKVESELETLKRRIEEGYIVDFDDYAYRPRERDWSASHGAISLRSRFDAAQDEFAARLETLCAFDRHFRAIPILADATQPHWENWWLPGLDAVALYGLVATLKPRLYVEVGSGHSTRFVRRAIEDNRLATRIVSIDPNPTAQVDAICDEVIRTSCEDTPLSRFAALEAGDILFVDGSHRSFQNSDATVFFTEILPSLAPGVVYGLHDVFLPYDYPASWLTRFYNEQYLLMAYLLGGAAGDEILFPAHHVSRHPAFALLRNRLFLGTKHLDWLVSSFWMRRADQAEAAVDKRPR